MRQIILVLLGCFILHIVPYVSGKHHNHHHHHHIHKNHLIRKRSVATANNKAPVNSLVEDVSESTAFRDREKKLRLVAEADELYPLHAQQLLAKRKMISKKPIQKQQHDDEAVYDNTEKKFKIAKGDDSQVDDDKTSDSDDDNDSDESGDSGDSEDDSNDDKNNDADSDDDDDKATTSKGKKRCHRQCKTPLTFHECAFPRCSDKLGTIKDLCFFLCKHQKEKCEEVCE